MAGAEVRREQALSRGACERDNPAAPLGLCDAQARVDRSSDDGAGAGRLLAVAGIRVAWCGCALNGSGRNKKGGPWARPSHQIAALRVQVLAPAPKSMTARRFCGSRTPGPVGTSGSWKLLPAIAIELPSMPWRTISFFTLSARRSERAWLYQSEPTVSVWPVTKTFTKPLAFAVR